MGVSSRHALRHPAQNLACSEFERTVGESGLWSRVYMSSCLRGILVVLMRTCTAGHGDPRWTLLSWRA